MFFASVHKTWLGTRREIWVGDIGDIKICMQ